MNIELNIFSSLVLHRRHPALFLPVIARALPDKPSCIPIIITKDIIFTSI